MSLPKSEIGLVQTNRQCYFSPKKHLSNENVLSPVAHCSSPLDVQAYELRSAALCTPVLREALRSHFSMIYLRSGNLGYPESNASKKVREAWFDLQEGLAPMEDDFAYYLIKSPPHGLDLMSVP